MVAPKVLNTKEILLPMPGAMTSIGELENFIRVAREEGFGNSSVVEYVLFSTTGIDSPSLRLVIRQ